MGGLRALRWILGGTAIVLSVVVLSLWGLRATQRRADPEGATAGARPPHRSADAGASAATSTWQLRGRVLSPEGPAVGASLVVSRPGARLSTLPCRLGVREEELSRCGCGEAARALVALLRADAAGEWLAAATSREDGSFVVDGLPAGEALLIEAQSGPSTGSRALLPTAEEVVIELGPERAVQGRVLEGTTGSAVAHVVALVDGLVPVGRADTDLDGRFRLAALPAGNYRVVAYREGLLPALAPAPPYRAHRADDRLMPLVLEPALTASGTVQDARGQPTAAMLEVRHPRCRVERSTDDAGRFELPALPPGRLELRAAAGARTGARSVSLEPGSRLDGLALALRAAARLEVMVASAEGTVLPRATVELECLEGACRSTQATFEPSAGRFVLEASPGSWRLSVRAPGFVTPRLPPVHLREGATWAKTVRLLRAATVAGQVLLPNGQPAGGVKLAVERSATTAGAAGLAASLTSTPATDEDGRFWLDLPRPGAYLLSFDPGARALPRAVRVTAPDASLSVRLESGVVLTGRLEDETGAPSPLAQVRADPGRAGSAVRLTRTDSMGAFAIAGLSAGTWEVIATERGARARSVRRTLRIAGTTPEPLLLRLPPRAFIAGQAVDESGAPLAEADIFALATDDATAEEPLDDWAQDGAAQASRRLEELKGRLAAAPVAHATREGRFRLDGLAPGTYRLFARAEGRASSSARVDWAQTGDGHVRLTAVPHGWVRARLVLPAGRACHPPQADGATPDQLLLPVELTGAVELNLTCDGMVPLHRQVATTFGRDVDLGVVHLSAARELSLRVMGPAGETASEAGFLAPGLGYEPRAEQVEPGRYVVAPLPQQMVRLVVREPGLGRAELEVPPGASTLEVRLSPGATLVGQLRDGQGQPVVDAWVAVGPEDGSRTDDDGAFRIEGLAGGEAELSVELAGDAEPAIRQKVQLPPRGEARVELVVPD